MTRFTPHALAITLVFATLVAAQDRAPRADRRGEALAARVLARQETSGFRIRARISTQDPAGRLSTPVNLRVLGRADATGTHVLYQALWPADIAGYAVAIARPPRAGASDGFLLEPPGRVTPLDASLRARGFLDTDLLIDDLVEDFWRWPLQQYSGDATVNGVACAVLESRAAATPVLPIPLVKSWITKTRDVPVRIEKYGADGRLARRIVFVRAGRKGRDEATPARLVVEPAHGRSSTTVEFFASERDVDVPASLFALEQLKRAAARQP